MTSQTATYTPHAVLGTAPLCAGEKVVRAGTDQADGVVDATSIKRPGSWSTPKLGV